VPTPFDPCRSVDGEGSSSNRTAVAEMASSLRSGWAIALSSRLVVAAKGGDNDGHGQATCVADVRGRYFIEDRWLASMDPLRCARNDGPMIRHPASLTENKAPRDGRALAQPIAT